jgi:hypothetical protein
MCQVGIRKTERSPGAVAGVAGDASLQNQVTSKPGVTFWPGISLAGVRLLARRCPAWRRREPDLLLPCGTWEGMPDTAARLLLGGERESSKWRPHEGLSTDAVACWRTGS